MPTVPSKPAAKPATKKIATKKAATTPRRATAKAAPPGTTAVTKTATVLRPSAGPLVLKDLGMTDAELAAFVPGPKPLMRGVYWCQFELDKTVDELLPMFRPPYRVKIGPDIKDPPRSAGAVPNLRLWPKGGYCMFNFIPQQGSKFNVAGHYQLMVTFRSFGTPWGSNQAVYERFKAVELTRLGAHAVRELTK
jgi:hypothetical protein